VRTDSEFGLVHAQSVFHVTGRCAVALGIVLTSVGGGVQQTHRGAVSILRGAKGHSAMADKRIPIGESLMVYTNFRIPIDFVGRIVVAGQVGDGGQWESGRVTAR